MQLLQGSTWRSRPGAIAGAAAGLFVMMSSSATAGVIRVDDDAPLLGDGQSWETAYRYLQDALAAAQPADEIRVARGVYKPDQTEGDIIVPDLRAATFQLLDDVTLLGGYAGLGAADPDERNVSLHKSVLSGDLLGNDPPESLAADFENYEENSYHVVTASGVSATAILDGFTIAGGFAENRNGGGVLSEAGSPLIRFCTIERNLATGSIDEATGVGAGLCFTGTSTPALRDLVIRANRVIGMVDWSGAGGGVGFLSGSEPTLERCDFVGNEAIGFDERAGWGAGLAFNEGTRAHVVDCVFTDNRSSAEHVQHAGGGGAMSIPAASDEVIVERCTFERNRGTLGGAVWLNTKALFTDCDFRDNESYVNTAGYSGWGGAMTIGTSARATVTRCTFESNDAEDKGGAIAIWAVSVDIRECAFDANTADALGGALWVQSTRPLAITNTSFTNNLAPQGGAIFEFAVRDGTLTNVLFAGNVAEYGGAVWNHYSFPILTNTTFADNTATVDGGAMYNETASAPFVRNSIFWGNAGGQIVDVDASVTTVDFCDVQDGWPGKGNIAVDAAFVDPANGDYHLAASSPCIDAGHSNAVPADAQDLDDDGDYAERIPFDLDGNWRFADARDVDDTGCGVPVIVDMGAYEFPGVHEDPMLIGDVTGDCLVAFDDLLEVLSAWGTCADDCCLADVDFDGEVGFDDLLRVLSNWS